MSVVAGVEPVVMASQTLESGPFYRDEMSKLLNKSEHSRSALALDGEVPEIAVDMRKS
jgi:hypothetical protein